LDPSKSTTKSKMHGLEKVEIKKILRKLNSLIDRREEKEVLKLLDIYKIFAGYPKGLTAIEELANEKNYIAQFTLKQSQGNKGNESAF